MVLRSLAGEFARNTAGAWKAVARAVDPDHTPTRRPTPADVEPVLEPEVAPEAAVEVGPDQMLVPIDAWTRILEQVGNLHEAGQELADAKERAARAETENLFLRDQLRDLKAERGTRRRPAAPTRADAAPEPEAPAPSETVTPPADRAARASARLRQVRSVAGRWISPD